MKIAIIILLIGALGAGVCNYFCKNNKENKMETPMLESAKGVDLYGDDEYVFLDVRTLNEHRAKAIPNSPVIPVQELESRVNELNKYKDKKINFDLDLNLDKTNFEVNFIESPTPFS